MQGGSLPTHAKFGPGHTKTSLLCNGSRTKTVVSAKSACVLQTLFAKSSQLVPEEDTPLPTKSVNVKALRENTPMAQAEPAAGQLGVGVIYNILVVGVASCRR